MTGFAVVVVWVALCRQGGGPCGPGPDGTYCEGPMRWPDALAIYERAAKSRRYFAGAVMPQLRAADDQELSKLCGERT